MTTVPCRFTGFTFKYLKRDGDTALSWRQLVMRQVSECTSEVRASIQRFGASGIRLSGWVIAYHAGMFLRPFASREIATLTLITDDVVQRVSFRKNQSDIYVLRENFVEQIYAYHGPGLDDVTNVVDLGANAGLSSLFFQTQYPNARIVCVEPVEMNVQLLERNRDQNSYDWVVLRAAVAAEPGKVTLYPNEWWSSSTTTEHVATARENNDGRLEKVLALPPETVEAVTVHEILDRAGLGAVDILKMDIEGAEERIFETDTSWLSRVRLLIIEIHDKYVDRSRIEQSIREAGFEQQIGRHGPTDAFRNKGLD